MKYQVVVTSHARRQLTDCANGWAEHRSAEQAVRWLDGFEEVLAGLAENPEKHSLAPENDLFDLPFAVRQLPYGVGKKPTHRAVFEIRTDSVYVVAIRHLAQAALPLDE